MQLARSLKVPCIYLSANSGARIGLPEEIKDLFDIAWNDPSDPDKVGRSYYIQVVQLIGAIIWMIIIIVTIVTVIRASSTCTWVQRSTRRWARRTPWRWRCWRRTGRSDTRSTPSSVSHPFPGVFCRPFVRLIRVILLIILLLVMLITYSITR